MLNFSEINVLGNICDELSSDLSANLDESLKMTYGMQGNILYLRLQMIVHFAGNRSLQIQIPGINDRANDLFADALSRIKSNFKESVGRAIKATEIKRESDVELISATANSPRKIGIYRANLQLEIE